jgi:hypothetical protein
MGRDLELVLSCSTVYQFLSESGLPVTHETVGKLPELREGQLFSFTNVKTVREMIPRRTLPVQGNTLWNQSHGYHGDLSLVVFPGKLATHDHHSRPSLAQVSR